jgi:hypothetical protein
MKTIRILIVLSLFVLFSVQASSVLANKGDEHNKPVTGPITSPITSPMMCKPGWGFGDKNHCHFGPPGHNDKGFNKFISDAFGKYFSEFRSQFHFNF